MKLEKQPEGSLIPPKTAKTGLRNVFLNSSKKYEEIPFYNVSELLANNQIKGPAIIDGVNTTIMMETGDIAEMDHIGNQIITIGEENE